MVLIDDIAMLAQDLGVASTQLVGAGAISQRSAAERLETAVKIPTEVVAPNVANIILNNPIILGIILVVGAVLLIIILK